MQGLSRPMADTAAANINLGFSPNHGEKEGPK